jgi:4-amino-4-deoxy-L-arabinose transferase-like glycosyltransferase
MSSPPRPESGLARYQDALYWAAFTLVAASFVVRQRMHGLAFPPPWPDEGSFLWPALAFSQTGSLYSPELFRARELYWMPPGYMILSGVLFKLTGFSFEWARTLSGLYLCGAFACVMATAARLRGRWGYLVLALIYMHSPIAVMAGNTARMETLVLLIAAAGFLLCERGLRASGLSVLSLAPLVHPNGAFVLGAGALLCLAPWRGNLALLRPHRLELIAIFAAGMCWLAYGLQIWGHYQEWVSDWAFQLKWKQYQATDNRGIGRRLLWPGLWIPALIFLATAFAAIRWKTPESRTTVPLAVFAFSLWLQTLTTVGWLYEVYAIVMQFLAAILGVELIAAWLCSGRIKSPRAARALPPVLALLAAGASAAFVVTSEFAMRSVTPSTRGGVWPKAPAYVTAEDRHHVAEYLKKLSQEGKPISVHFAPDADALIFQHLRSPTLQFSQQIMGLEHADVYIFHDSVWLPKFFRDYMLVRLAFGYKIPIVVEEWPVIYQRERTERWRVYRRPPPEEPAAQ